MSLSVLKQQLKEKNIGRLYYLYGEEEYLKRYYYNALRENFAGEMEQFNVLEPASEKLTVEELADMIERYPMMQDSKFIGIIDLPHAMLTEAYKKKLKTQLSDIPEFTTLVFMDTVQKSGKDAVLERIVQKAGGLTVDIKSPEPAALISWCRRHIETQGKTITNADLRYFVERVENDMMSLKSEIDKVCAYAKQDQITREDIDTVTIRSLVSNRYIISDALLRRDFKTMLTVLEQLYVQNIEEIVIANILYRAVCDLMRAKWAIAAGKTQRDLASDFGMTPYGAGKMMQAARAMEESYLQKALQIMMDFERKFKRAGVDKKELVYATVGALAALERA